LVEVSTADRRLAVAICRSGSSYSYFSRDKADPHWGVYVPATAGTSDFQAWYPGNEKGSPNYIVNSAGVTAGRALDSPKFVCGNRDQLPSAWTAVLDGAKAARSCTSSNVPAWTP
jgi:hypothetical protein